jgi:Kazal-type serine protease inhibitor domain
VQAHRGGQHEGLGGAGTFATPVGRGTARRLSQTSPPPPATLDDEAPPTGAPPAARPADAFSCPCPDLSSRDPPLVCGFKTVATFYPCPSLPNPDPNAPPDLPGPCDCPLVAESVCTTDDVTYANACLAACAAKVVASQSACDGFDDYFEDPGTGPVPEDFGADCCPTGSFCCGATCVADAYVTGIACPHEPGKDCCSKFMPLPPPAPAPPGGAQL